MCHSSCAWRFQGLVRPPHAQITCILYKGPSAVLFVTDCHTAVSASLHFLPCFPWQSSPPHLFHSIPWCTTSLALPFSFCALTSSLPSFPCNRCFPAMNISSLPPPQQQHHPGVTRDVEATGSPHVTQILGETTRGQY